MQYVKDYIMRGLDMLVKNLPKLIMGMFLIGTLSVITSCAPPQQTEEPTGGAAPTDQQEQRQYCPTANETGGTGGTQERPMNGEPGGM